ncbi:MAG: hypothetical protein R3F59_32970 [Myxococcota bacterium]
MSSRIPGFYKLPPDGRLRALQPLGLREVDLAAYREGLSLEAADLMVENVIGTFSLPCAVAVNFLINREDRVVPMVVEEPSVVAAVSNVARLARADGGFTAESDRAHMIGQIQLMDVRDPEGAVTRLQEALPALASRRRACTRGSRSAAAGSSTSRCGGWSTTSPGGRSSRWWWSSSCSTWSTPWAPTW